MVGGTLRVLRLYPPTKTGRHDIAEILLKVALNTKIQIQIHNTGKKKQSACIPYEKLNLQMF
jgi:hypothetical protein